MWSSRFGSSAFWPMLVRRMATVTISAPLASMACRVSSRLWYLPVPTSRREWYVLPAMISGSSVVPGLAGVLVGEAVPVGLGGGGGMMAGL